MNIIKDYLTYFQDKPKGYWFKRKLYGWGWTPSSWQGWLITLVYIGLVVCLSLTVDETAPTKDLTFNFSIPITLLSLVFIYIAYKKGEKPGWRWGSKK